MARAFSFHRSFHRHSTTRCHDSDHDARERRRGLTTRLRFLYYDYITRLRTMSSAYTAANVGPRPRRGDDSALRPKAQARPRLSDANKKSPSSRPRPRPRPRHPPLESDSRTAVSVARSCLRYMIKMMPPPCDAQPHDCGGTDDANTSATRQRHDAVVGRRGVWGAAAAAASASLGACWTLRPPMLCMAGA